MGPAQPKSQTVLIVEDDAELRRLMVTLLEDEQLDASGLPREYVRQLPPGIAYMVKPFQPLDVLVIAEQARASSQRGERVPTSLVYQQRQPRAPVAHATNERRSAS
jgi:hypothetical protein